MSAKSKKIETEILNLLDICQELFDSEPEKVKKIENSKSLIKAAFQLQDEIVNLHEKRFTNQVDYKCVMAGKAGEKLRDMLKEGKNIHDISAELEIKKELEIIEKIKKHPNAAILEDGSWVISFEDFKNL